MHALNSLICKQPLRIPILMIHWKLHGTRLTGGDSQVRKQTWPFRHHNVALRSPISKALSTRTEYRISTLILANRSFNCQTMINRLYEYGWPSETSRPVKSFTPLTIYNRYHIIIHVCFDFTFSMFSYFPCNYEGILDTWFFPSSKLISISIIDLPWE